ncbi:uncharacterized protein BDR25DRAFT_344454 [Lindgomyces ingoldianus]|uniref:Uncharacterized protein n=1 Tax=Lindgomyces ingoldianus TaxID=673940 RepID=A0ACB6QNL1_9PLEO|nr:uncharacterized protein BDR25DRAFT_344454 [Lindgomyces ingoldianus]KAF2468158.1 hypothetical protein BDR25DRAFT_344454 [Lindgomyces ingoldianus]
MSYLNAILSSIDPSVSAPAPAQGARQAQAPNVPKPAQRPVASVIGTSQAHPLKRKAESQTDGSQPKIQRKDVPLQGHRTNGSARPSPAPEMAKSKPSAPADPAPYRGTAATGALGATKSLTIINRPSPGASTPAATSKSTMVKKPSPTASIAATSSKLTPAGSRPTAGVAPTPGAPPMQPKKGSYAAMLAKAKEVQVAKPAPPPIKHEPMKVLTKKERMALHAEAKAGAKGKRPGLNSPAGTVRVADVKGEAGKEKRKPADLGYQGTARPIKKPAEISYKGTARPITAAGSAGRAGNSNDRSRSNSLAAKSKPKQDRGKYGGYASWSDDDIEDEEDYASDGSSDMEGGIWDVEQEEQRALLAAKKEDADALREENELKRQKEERKKKLMAMNKAAAAKRKY